MSEKNNQKTDKPAPKKALLLSVEKDETKEAFKKRVIEKLRKKGLLEDKEDS